MGINITEKEFWDHFWTNITLPSRVNENFSNDRITADFLKKNLPSGEKNKTALEIGCAPGKWMIFLNEELQYLVEG